MPSLVMNVREFNVSHTYCLKESGFCFTGNILPGDVIKSNLAYILNDQCGPAEYPVGVFTTQDRDLWTDMREKLVAAGKYV